MRRIKCKKIIPSYRYNVVATCTWRHPKHGEFVPSLHLGSYRMRIFAQITTFVFNLCFMSGGLYRVSVMALDPYLLRSEMPSMVPMTNNSNSSLQ
jgi:hypothetical protein